MLEYVFYFAAILGGLAIAFIGALLVSMWRHHRMINTQFDPRMFRFEDDDLTQKEAQVLQAQFRANGNWNYQAADALEGLASGKIKNTGKIIYRCQLMGRNSLLFAR